MVTGIRIFRREQEAGIGEDRGGEGKEGLFEGEEESNLRIEIIRGRQKVKMEEIK